MSVLDSDRQHRMVVAAAARYDHHPDLVVPVDCDSRNNNRSGSSSSYGKRGMSRQQQQQQQQQQQYHHQDRGGGSYSNLNQRHNHQHRHVPQQQQQHVGYHVRQQQQQHQHQHQQQQQQQRQQHVRYCQHHSRQASYSSSSGASSSSSTSSSSNGRPSSSMSGLMMTNSNSRHEEEMLMKREARESVSPMREEGLKTIKEQRKTSRDVQQKFEKLGRTKKMERGISKASENELIVVQARHNVESHFQGGDRGSPDSPDSVGFVSGVVPGAVTATSSASPSGFVDTPVYTFTLPDLTLYPEDYRNFLERDLIELSSLVSLEGSGRLNWWAETGACQRLWPLATTGDGNCLLHAASLGMWGFHDRLLTLRKALHHFLSSSVAAAAIYRRWRYQSHLQNMQYGLVLSEREWTDEWKSVLRLASSEPRHGSSSSASSSSEGNSTSSSTSVTATSNKAATRRLSRLSMAMGDSINEQQQQQQQQPLYESLEEVHVLALAHVLRRPIIVVADTVLKDLNGDALAPINFGGVYLPLECPPTECHRSPLLLTYNAGHFSALVSMERGLSSNSSRSETPSLVNEQTPYVPAVIPLTDSEHSMLPLHFAVDPGAEFCWNRDEFDPDTGRELALTDQDRYNLLNSYLEVVKVALPDWFLEGSPSPEPEENSLPPPLPPSSHSIHHQTSNKQNKASVAKQFGSIGKKLKKNLGKLTRTSSFKNKPRGSLQDEVDGDMALALRQSLDNYNQQQQQQQQQKKIVGSAQPFILSAFIHASVQRPPPYQTEMVENYLQEARRRYEKDRENRRKQRQEKEEQEEARKREIYLNGGYRDCSTNGCRGRAASIAEDDSSEGAYLCKNCLEDRRSTSRHGNSRFYAATSSSSDEGDGRTSSRSDWESSERMATGLTVKLPPPGSCSTTASSSSSADQNKAKSAPIMGGGGPCSSPRPCRGDNCQFFGTSEMRGYCSKCFLKMRER